MFHRLEGEDNHARPTPGDPSDGGFDLPQEAVVREKFKDLASVTLVDFLLYVPLFVMIHESIIANPLRRLMVK